MQILVNSPKGGIAVVDPFKKRVIKYTPSKEYLEAKAKLDKIKKINAEQKMHSKRLAHSFVRICVFPKLLRSLFHV